VEILLYSATADMPVRAPVSAASLDLAQRDATRPQPLCSVFSDSRGVFVFRNAAPGAYTLVPLYREDLTVYEVAPPVCNTSSLFLSIASSNCVHFMADTAIFRTVTP
jgi:hypothetical protein